MEIYVVGDKICQVIENEKLSLGKEKDALLNTAKLLSEKVVVIESDQNFDSKIKGSTIIRRANREFSFHIYSIEAYGYEHAEYFKIVRPLIAEYRLLFNDSMGVSHKLYKEIDLWDLLKPYGDGSADIY